MTRAHFESVAAWSQALCDWQDESWVRQGKPEWKLRVVNTTLDKQTLRLNVDVLGGSELFLSSLPATAVLGRLEITIECTLKACLE